MHFIFYVLPVGTINNDDNKKHLKWLKKVTYNNNDKFDNNDTTIYKAP